MHSDRKCIEWSHFGPPQARKFGGIYVFFATQRGSQRTPRHHSDVLSTISGALAWRGRPCVGALAGGSLTPLDPPHHTGGLYFAWLRLNFFRALRAPVFSYIRGLSNVEREV